MTDQRRHASVGHLRERFDEPIQTATRVTRRTLAWFPVRVWRRFLQRNGFLLAAGVSYQALFAVSAVVYVAFAVAGLWLGGSPVAVDGLIDLINGYIPGLISSEGLFSPEEVREVARNTTGVLSVTGAIALTVAVWTAIGWVTLSRRAVREVFGLKPDLRSYVMLKARDFGAAVVFGAALLVGGATSFIGTWALNLIASLMGWESTSQSVNVLVRIAFVMVSFVLNTVVLTAMFRFLTNTTLRARRIWPGALVGGVGLTVVQVGAGLLVGYSPSNPLLVGYSPSNPLLATFAIFIGLLLWFRIVGVVILVAAAWVAVAAEDDDTPILPGTAKERYEQEHEALVFAGRVRLRAAQDEASDAGWIRRWGARRRVAVAARELDELETAGADRTRKAAL